MNNDNFEIDPLTPLEKIGAFVAIAVIYIAHASFIIWLFT